MARTEWCGVHLTHVPKTHMPDSRKTSKNKPPSVHGADLHITGTPLSVAALARSTSQHNSAARRRRSDEARRSGRAVGKSATTRLSARQLDSRPPKAEASVLCGHDLTKHNRPPPPHAFHQLSVVFR